MPKPSKALLEEGFFTFKKKAGSDLCWVKGCHKESRPDRCLCSAHYMQRWRAKNRKTSLYCTLRDHAKARGIEFDLTVDYWEGLVDTYSYFEQKDGAKEVLSIDRIDATKGYVRRNVRVVSVGWNIFKSNRERFLPEHIQHMMERRRKKSREEIRKHLDMDPGAAEMTDECWEERDLLARSQQEQTLGEGKCPF